MFNFNLEKERFSMLDEKTIKTVKETAPVLKEHSNEIGKRFYQLLFKKVPDLYNLFNQTNQNEAFSKKRLLIRFMRQVKI